MSDNISDDRPPTYEQLREGLDRADQAVMILNRLANEQQQQIGDLKALLNEAANMLDKAAAKPFIMGKGAVHWDEVQAMIDRMREAAK